MRRARNFCVTYNNYENNTIELLKSVECIKYAVFGEEIASTGTPHLQGYVQLKQAKTISAFQKILKRNGLKCSIQVANGSWQQNYDYCSGNVKKKDKPNEVVHEWGVVKKQGERNDLNSMYNAIKEGKDDYYLQENFTSTYMKFYKAAAKVRTNYKQHKAFEKLKKSFSNAKHKPWQKQQLANLETQKGRYVDWVVDPTGNIGKTWLAKYLLTQKDTFYCQGGKIADIAYAFDYQEYVVFDFTKSQREYVNYTAIECFKNGVVFSPKYESMTKVFDTCKVIVFANWPPDQSKLVDDRWRIHHVNC